jgi:hypothetical protein
MDYADLLSTLRYIGSTPPAVLGEQLIEEVGNTYTKESEPPSSKNSQLASGARRDYQSSKYSGNTSMEKESGVIMTPEAVKELEAKKQALIQKRMDLERKRRMDEYDQRARARGLRVQDTLEKIGLGK